MPVEYADSYGGLGQADIAYAGLRQRGLESALGTAVSALQNMRARQIQSDQFTRTLSQNQARLAAENEHWKSQAQQAADKQESDSTYQQWLMGQDSPTKTRDRELDEKFVVDLGKAGRILSPEHAKQIAPNASDTARNIAFEYSKDAQASQEQDFSRAHALASALNVKADADSKIASLNKENEELKKVHVFFSGPTAAAHAKVKEDQNTELINQLTAQKLAVDRTLKPFVDNKLIDRYVQPSQEVPGTFEPAVPTPYHMLQRRVNDVDSSVMPLNTIPNRRTYGMSGRTPNFVPAPARAEPAQMAPGMPDNPPVPQDNAPAPMIVSPRATSTSTQGGGDKRSWVINRAKELGATMDIQSAVAQARKEYELTQ